MLDSSLGRMYTTFLKLSHNINEVSTVTTMDEEQDAEVTRISKLLVHAEQLRTTLSRVAVTATDTKTVRTASRFLGEETITLREMCLSELMSAVSAMAVHLSIFRMGSSPFETTGTGDDRRCIVIAIGAIELEWGFWDRGIFYDRFMGLHKLGNYWVCEAKLSVDTHYSIFLSTGKM